MSEEALNERDISCEEYREYEFGGTTYRVCKPLRLFYRSGGSTHRVLDSEGVVHCVPAPGVKDCVLRWMPKDRSKPVAF